MPNQTSMQRFLRSHRDADFWSKDDPQRYAQRESEMASRVNELRRQIQQAYADSGIEEPSFSLREVAPGTIAYKSSGTVELLTYEPQLDASFLLSDSLIPATGPSEHAMQGVASALVNITARRETKMDVINRAIGLRGYRPYLHGADAGGTVGGARSPHYMQMLNQMRYFPQDVREHLDLFSGDEDKVAEVIRGMHPEAGALASHLRGDIGMDNVKKPPIFLKNMGAIYEQIVGMNALPDGRVVISDTGKFNRLRNYTNTTTERTGFHNQEDLHRSRLHPAAGSPSEQLRLNTAWMPNYPEALGQIQIHEKAALERSHFRLDYGREAIDLDELGSLRMVRNRDVYENRSGTPQGAPVYEYSGYVHHHKVGGMYRHSATNVMVNLPFQEESVGSVANAIRTTSQSAWNALTSKQQDILMRHGVGSEDAFEEMADMNARLSRHGYAILGGDGGNRASINYGVAGERYTGTATKVAGEAKGVFVAMQSLPGNLERTGAEAFVGGSEPFKGGEIYPKALIEMLGNTPEGRDFLSKSYGIRPDNLGVYRWNPTGDRQNDPYVRMARELMTQRGMRSIEHLLPANSIIRDHTVVDEVDVNEANVMFGRHGFDFGQSYNGITYEQIPGTNRAKRTVVGDVYNMPVFYTTVATLNERRSGRTNMADAARALRNLEPLAAQAYLDNMTEHTSHAQSLLRSFVNLSSPSSSVVTDPVFLDSLAMAKTKEKYPEWEKSLPSVEGQLQALQELYGDNPMTFRIDDTEVNLPSAGSLLRMSASTATGSELNRAVLRALDVVRAHSTGDAGFLANTGVRYRHALNQTIGQQEIKAMGGGDLENSHIAVALQSSMLPVGLNATNVLGSSLTAYGQALRQPLIEEGTSSSIEQFISMQEAKRRFMPNISLDPRLNLQNVVAFNTPYSTGQKDEDVDGDLDLVHILGQDYSQVDTDGKLKVYKSPLASSVKTRRETIRQMLVSNGYSPSQIDNIRMLPESEQWKVLSSGILNGRVINRSIAEDDGNYGPEGQQVQRKLFDWLGSFGGTIDEYVNKWFDVDRGRHGSATTTDMIKSSFREASAKQATGMVANWLEDFLAVTGAAPESLGITSSDVEGIVAAHGFVRKTTIDSGGGRSGLKNFRDLIFPLTARNAPRPEDFERGPESQIKRAFLQAIKSFSEFGVSPEVFSFMAATPDGPSRDEITRILSSVDMNTPGWENEIASSLGDLSESLFGGLMTAQTAVKNLNPHSGTHSTFVQNRNWQGINAHRLALNLQTRKSVAGNRPQSNVLNEDGTVDLSKLAIGIKHLIDADTTDPTAQILGMWLGDSLSGVSARTANGSLLRGRLSDSDRDLILDQSTRVRASELDSDPATGRSKFIWDMATAGLDTAGDTAAGDGDLLDRRNYGNRVHQILNDLVDNEGDPNILSEISIENIPTADPIFAGRNLGSSIIDLMVGGKVVDIKPHKTGNQLYNYHKYQLSAYARAVGQDTFSIATYSFPAEAKTRYEQEQAAQSAALQILNDAKQGNLREYDALPRSDVEARVSEIGGLKSSTTTIAENVRIAIRDGRIDINKLQEGRSYPEQLQEIEKVVEAAQSGDWSDVAGLAGGGSPNAYQHRLPGLEGSEVSEEIQTQPIAEVPDTAGNSLASLTQFAQTMTNFLQTLSEGGGTGGRGASGGWGGGNRPLPPGEARRAREINRLVANNARFDLSEASYHFGDPDPTRSTLPGPANTIQKYVLGVNETDELLGRIIENVDDFSGTLAGLSLNLIEVNKVTKDLAVTEKRLISLRGKAEPSEQGYVTDANEQIERVQATRSKSLQASAALQGKLFEMLGPRLQQAHLTDGQIDPQKVLDSYGKFDIRETPLRTGGKEARFLQQAAADRITEAEHSPGIAEYIDKALNSAPIWRLGMAGMMHSRIESILMSPMRDTHAAFYEAQQSRYASQYAIEGAPTRYADLPSGGALSPQAIQSREYNRNYVRIAAGERNQEWYQRAGDVYDSMFSRESQIGHRAVADRTMAMLGIAGMAMNYGWVASTGLGAARGLRNALSGSTPFAAHYQAARGGVGSARAMLSDPMSRTSGFSQGLQKYGGTALGLLGRYAVPAAIGLGAVDLLGDMYKTFTADSPEELDGGNWFADLTGKSARGQQWTEEMAQNDARAQEIFDDPNASLGMKARALAYRSFITNAPNLQRLGRAALEDVFGHNPYEKTALQERLQMQENYSTGVYQNVSSMDDLVDELGLLGVNADPNAIRSGITQYMVANEIDDVGYFNTPEGYKARETLASQLSLFSVSGATSSQQSQFAYGISGAFGARSDMKRLINQRVAEISMSDARRASIYGAATGAYGDYLNRLPISAEEKQRRLFSAYRPEEYGDTSDRVGVWYNHLGQQYDDKYASQALNLAENYALASGMVPGSQQYQDSVDRSLGTQLYSMDSNWLTNRNMGAERAASLHGLSPETSLGRMVGSRLENRTAEQIGLMDLGKQFANVISNEMGVSPHTPQGEDLQLALGGMIDAGVSPSLMGGAASLVARLSRTGQMTNEQAKKMVGSLTSDSQITPAALNRMSSLLFPSNEMDYNLLQQNPELMKVREDAGLPPISDNRTMNTETGLSVWHDSTMALNRLSMAASHSYTNWNVQHQMRTGQLNYAHNVRMNEFNPVYNVVNPSLSPDDPNYIVQSGVASDTQPGPGLAVQQDPQQGLGLNQQMRLLNYNQNMAGLQRSASHASQNFAMQMAERGLSRRMMMMNFEQQTIDMDLGRERSLERRGWRQEDMAFNREVAGLRFSWQQEDLGRNIRLSTGRQRRELIRQRDRGEVMFGMEEDQRNRQEDRFKTQAEWEDEDFDRKKSHFEEMKSLQTELFDMQTSHMARRHAMQMENINAQITNIEERKKLEDTIAEEQFKKAEDDYALWLERMQKQIEFNETMQSIDEARLNIQEDQQIALALMTTQMHTVNNDVLPAMEALLVKILELLKAAQGGGEEEDPPPPPPPEGGGGGDNENPDPKPEVKRIPLNNVNNSVQVKNKDNTDQTLERWAPSVRHQRKVSGSIDSLRGY